jgi:hypothetical protein
VCSNPEFLREGTSIKDFYDPPFTLIGAHDPAHAEPVAALYAGINAPVHVAAVRVAEMVKYACNCFHGLKIGFANEVGNVCKALGIDSHEVMRLFCEDRKLNISPAYLKPGFAFGGSCLPKDLRALTYQARTLDVDTPIMSATLESNQRQIDRAFHMVMAAGGAASACSASPSRPAPTTCARAPDGGAHRDAHRQGARGEHLRPVRARGEPHGREPRVHRARDPAHLDAHARERRGGARRRGDGGDRQQRERVQGARRAARRRARR